MTVTFTEEEYTVNEDDGTVEVCVEKDSDIAESFTVSLPTQDGSAEGEYSTSVMSDFVYSSAVQTLLFSWS